VRHLLVLILLVTATTDGSSPALAPAAASSPVVLVELFTSEGCSSCPPADALLAELARERAHGIRVVPLSEHVDYWDGPDWRDRFSSPAFTRRQEAYARRLGVSSLYTPQLVVMGRAHVLGSDRRAAQAAIAAAPRDPSARVAARLVPDAHARRIVGVDATWRDGVPADVLVAVTRDRATTHVAGGENAGRTLEHVAVVRSLTVIGAGAGAFSGEVALSPTDPGTAGQVIVFVQERDGGPVLGATALVVP
jgi:hypothetical protein